MARPKLTVPNYKLHRPSGQAVCYVDRQRVYLGRFGSPESKEKFAAIVASRMADATRSDAVKVAASSSRPAKVSELLLRFVTEELPRYSAAEQRCFHGVIRIVRQYFSATPASEFGPLKLRVVRQSMIDGAKSADLPPLPDGTPAKDRKPWSRSFTNKQVKRLRQLFRFGVSWEMVPQAVADSLATVKSLSAGESQAGESSPRTAVPEGDLAAVRGVLCELHRDLFDLLLLTGGRPGEIIGLTTGMIERTGDVWKAELESHKTAHKGKRRVLFFNSRAQEILKRHLKADPAAHLFRIRRDTFSDAIKAACVRAGVKVFTPHWIRHTVATKLTDAVGLEHAQRLLGHSQAAMTHHYARMADRLATEAVQQLG